MFHPHLHCLVTGGGLTDAGQWRAVRNGFLLPARVVMAVFRGKLLAALRQGGGARGSSAAGGPEPPAAGESAQQAGPPEVERAHPGAVSHGAGVLTYLARYLGVGPSPTSGWSRVRRAWSPSAIG